jgi:hypothetical protein
LRYEQELACDDLTTQVTRQSLGLASALTKVWLQTLGDDSSGQEAVPSLTGTGEQMEERIRRLFTPAVPARLTVATWMPLLSRCCILLCLLLPGLFNTVMILHFMGCGLLS